MAPLIIMSSTKAVLFIMVFASLLLAWILPAFLNQIHMIATRGAVALTAATFTACSVISTFVVAAYLFGLEESPL